MEPITTAQIKSALLVMLAVSETIRELGEVPSGILYNSLLQRYPSMSATTFAQLTGRLKETGLVAESAHVLRWVGPRF